ncbi:MAG: polyprenyl synthetase family protein [Deltaproteobacteria bacterium]|nr:polyprenyl synthetase family protein [Deltaproteobacteria bacterium]
MPSDWPLPGRIDLARHDLPHPSSTTEWWYLNAHVELAAGREASLFAAFFRILSGKDAQGLPTYAHSVAWALSDPRGGVYASDSRVDAQAPRLGLERIKNGRGSRDPRLNRAISELLEQGRVPAPDRVFDGPVALAGDRLGLDFGGLLFSSQGDGTYRLSLRDHGGQNGCELVFAPEKPAIRHGDDGVVHGPDGEEMFYYFLPRCRVKGEVTLAGEHLGVVRGQGWYDHEFGRPASDAGAGAIAYDPQGPKFERTEVAWNWLAAQLDDGTDVSAYALVRNSDGKVLQQCAVVVDPKGERAAFHELTLTPERPWRSIRTFHDYPTQWTLAVPRAGLSLVLSASFADQEFVTVISKTAFWEGRCAVLGALHGKSLRGLAYVERSGFAPIPDLDSFFSAVGEEVRAAVARTLPLELSQAHAQELIASKDRPQYMDGVDTTQLSRALLAPIREVTDRGGKSWRSYAALACCEVVGGDSRRFSKWLAMPELLHVGSLIVDDVEDRSTVRRGGPAAHLVYGEPIAINAGTAAYFLTQHLLVGSGVELTAERKLRLYDLYFEAMRAGHAGQALDLDGLGAAMPEVVERGDGATLERRILATHRLKTAAPAASLARMGAVAGGGTDAQIDAVGRFFEALGLAFQIVDDILNLRGFRGGLKTRAEDITNGVVTLPIARAMSRLGPEQRRELWRVLQAKTTDAQVLSGAVELLESCGAVQSCADDARALVEEAWQRAEPLLSDSLSKVMLRAFGWYVLERHY